MSKRNYDFTTYLTKERTNTLDRFTAHQYEKTIQNLMEKIDILTSKLQGSDKAKLDILSSYKYMEDENTSLQYEIQHYSQENNRLVSLSQSYSSQIKALQEEIASLKEKYKTKFDIINRELMQKESEVMKLTMDMKEKDDKLTHMQVNNSITLQYSNNYLEECERQKTINKSQLAKINEQEKLINELYLNKNSEANLLLENEHLRDDNIRMLQMLKTTNEYKDFAFLNQTTPGGIRYVHDDIAIKNSHHDCHIAKSLANFKKNCDSWIPSEVYDIVLNYNKKYNLEFNEKVINDLLASLNTIWKQREDKLILKFKTKHQREIIDLKRKCGIGIHPLSDTISPNNTIINKPKTAGNRALKKSNSKGKELVVNALKVAESFNNTKKALEKEIVSLKAKLSERDSKLKSKETKGSEEDSIRLISKTIIEVDKIMSSFNDLFSQYTERVKDTQIRSDSLEEANHHIKLIHNTVQWFFTSLRDSIDNLHLVLSSWQREISNQYS